MGLTKKKYSSIESPKRKTRTMTLSKSRQSTSQSVKQREIRYENNKAKKLAENYLNIYRIYKIKRTGLKKGLFNSYKVATVDDVMKVLVKLDRANPEKFQAVTESDKKLQKIAQNWKNKQNRKMTKKN